MASKALNMLATGLVAGLSCWILGAVSPRRVEVQASPAAPVPPGRAGWEWGSPREVQRPDRRRPQSPPSIPSKANGLEMAGPEQPVMAAALRPLFDAIAWVESRNNPYAVGAAGERGMYQIGRAYFRDGVRNSAWKWTYNEAVWSPSLCRKVMIRYWKRYCPGALARRDWETLARVHNGGPHGHRNPATLIYWERVRQAMEKK